MPTAFALGFIVCTLLWIPIPSDPIPDPYSPFVKWIATDMKVPVKEITARRLRRLKTLHIPNLGYELESLDGLEFCTNLESLTIEHQVVCHMSGDCGTCNGPFPDLQPISALTELRVLKLGEDHERLPEYLAPLQKLERLEMEVFMDHDWQEFPGLPRLRVLSYNSFYKKATGWGGPGKLPALEEATFRSVMFESDSLVRLCGDLPQVHTLRFPYAYFIETLTPLQEVPKLRLLDLTGMSGWNPAMLASAQAIQAGGVEVIGMPTSITP